MQRMILQPFQPSKLKFLKFHRQGALPTLAPFHSQYNDLSLSHNFKPQMSAVDNFAIGVVWVQSVHLRKLRSGFDSRCRRKIYSFGHLSICRTCQVIKLSSFSSYCFLRLCASCKELTIGISLSLSLSLTNKNFVLRIEWIFSKANEVTFRSKASYFAPASGFESLICNPVVIFV